MGRCHTLGVLVLWAALTAVSAAPPQRPAAQSWERIKSQGSFTVSLDPDNLPYSAREGKQNGIEVELVHALAKQLGLTARIQWLHTAHETSLRHLLDAKCDLVPGLPIDPRLHDDDDPAAKRILYTRPYCRAGYLIFVRKNGPRVARLDELKGDQGSRLGTQAGTVADFVLKQRGYPRKLFGSQESALKALAAGQIDYAYLWSNAAWLVRAADKSAALPHPNPPPQGGRELAVEIVQPYELEDWRDMALAVRKGDDDLRKHLDSALAQLAQQKTIEQLLSRYGLPYYPSIEAKAAAKDAAKP